MTASLTLLQWLSPAFPTGAFAYSHGLEQLIADAIVHDTASLAEWLSGILIHGAGWQDAVLLSQGLREGADYGHLRDLARALAPSAERLTETLEQGTALARTISGILGQEIPPAPLPVALAQAAAPLGLPPPQVIALYLHSFASNLVTIATRAIPLGQTQAQRLLASLHPKISQIAESASSAGLDQLGNAAIAADLAAMRHETLEIRLFRT